MSLSSRFRRVRSGHLQCIRPASLPPGVALRSHLASQVTDCRSSHGIRIRVVVPKPLVHPPCRWRLSGLTTPYSVRSSNDLTSTRDSQRAARQQGSCCRAFNLAFDSFYKALAAVSPSRRLGRATKTPRLPSAARCIAVRCSATPPYPSQHLRLAFWWCPRGGVPGCWRWCHLLPGMTGLGFDNCLLLLVLPTPHCDYLCACALPLVS